MKKKRIFIILILIALTLTILVSLCFGKNNNKTFIKDGVLFALTLDGLAISDFPERGDYSVEIDCDNAVGKWLPKEWKFVLENITGKDTVNLFRAPYGAYNNNLLNIAKDEFGLNTIQWDVDTLDWKGLTGVEICNRVMDKVKNGSIILCHNNSDHILDALPLVLTSLINAGYKVTSVGELIMHDNYYIDNLGIQRKNI